VTELEFLRDYVSASRPLILTDLDASDWPCLHRWTDEYLLKTAGDAKVSVNVTAGGWGDYVDEASGKFVKPLEESMPFREFWDVLSQPASDAAGVPYLSYQNDSLREQLPALAEDVPSALPLGVAAFGNEPEAVNLWIGDGRAVSSCHKDHYENLYLVVRGEKIFTLLPPAVVPFLHERRCSPAQFARSGQPNSRQGGLHVVPDETSPEHVPWVPVDVSAPDLDRFPAFVRASAVEARVRPGELLYLPAMWYHQVAQRGVTIAVNYWHDMPFGHGFIHHQFIRDVVGLNDDDPEDPFAHLDDDWIDPHGNPWDVGPEEDEEEGAQDSAEPLFVPASK